MPRYVALLRGVNVGGHNKIPMPALRTVFEELGFDDVTTFIQSGNVVFSSPKAPTAAKLEAAVKSSFGVETDVMLRTSAELKRILKANAFPKADPKAVHIGFLKRKPTAAALKALDAEAFTPEEFAYKGTEVYLHLPNGMGRTKLPAYLDRRVKVPVTIRTLKSVTKLAELAAG